MDLKVQIFEANSHLVITAVGQYTLIDILALFDTVKEESEKRAESKVILDITEIVGAIPFMDMLGLGEHCSKCWKQPLRVAIVSRAGGLNDFFEIVARNRGVQLAVVPNHQAAIEWLRY